MFSAYAASTVPLALSLNVIAVANTARKYCSASQNECSAWGRLFSWCGAACGVAHANFLEQSSPPSMAALEHKMTSVEGLQTAALVFQPLVVMSARTVHTARISTPH